MTIIIVARTELREIEGRVSVFIRRDKRRDPRIGLSMSVATLVRRDQRRDKTQGLVRACDFDDKIGRLSPFFFPRTVRAALCSGARLGATAWVYR